MKINNYPSWLVSVEIAKKLRDIGFDLPCAFVLTNKDKIGFTTKGGNQYHLLEELDLNSNSKGSLVCVPAFEQVFEWFRSKGYHSTLHTYSVMVRNVEEFRFFYEINSNHDYIANPEEYYKTYEEAREALIREMINIYCLKL